VFRHRAGRIGNRHKGNVDFFRCSRTRGLLQTFLGVLGIGPARHTGRRVLQRLPCTDGSEQDPAPRHALLLACRGASFSIGHPLSNCYPASSIVRSVGGSKGKRGMGSEIAPGIWQVRCHVQQGPRQGLDRLAREFDIVVHRGGGLEQEVPEQSM
jgi:hypothetical protein